MHTELYCTTLDQLDRVKAVRAIHEALLQLAATSRAAGDEGFDNAPAIAALGECLAQAGRVGYGGETPGPAQPMRPSGEHFRLRRHHGNKDAWALVVVNEKGEEGSVSVTALSADTLLAKVAPGERCEVVV